MVFAADHARTPKTCGPPQRMVFGADHARTLKTWGPTQRVAFGADQACMPKTVRAEGPGRRSAKCSPATEARPAIIDSSSLQHLSAQRANDS